MGERTLKNRFLSKSLKTEAKYCENWGRFLYELWFQVGIKFFQSEKTIV